MGKFSENNLTPAQQRLLKKIGRGENIWQGTVQSVEIVLQVLIYQGYVYLADIENETYALSWSGKRLLKGLKDG